VRLQHARDVAWRALNRRDHTVAELARILARKRAEPAVIDAVVGELCEQGYLDDARFAHRFAEDRRRLDGWGAERIEQRLRALGVAGELVEAAVSTRDPEGELEAALALLRRRFPAPPATPRDCERALGMLVRKGYELELAHDAIRRHVGVPAFE
jgi:regulatory protein